MSASLAALENLGMVMLSRRKNCWTIVNDKAENRVHVKKAMTALTMRGRRKPFSRRKRYG